MENEQIEEELTPRERIFKIIDEISGAGINRKDCQPLHACFSNSSAE